MANNAIRLHMVTDFYTANSSHVVHELNGIYIADGNAPYLESLLLGLIDQGAGRVKDWAGNGKRVDACRKLLNDSGYSCELRYDAAHGRRYKMACYNIGGPDSRRRALAACDGMRNTNPELSA